MVFNCRSFNPHHWSKDRRRPPGNNYWRITRFELSATSFDFAFFCKEGKEGGTENEDRCELEDGATISS